MSRGKDTRALGIALAIAYWLPAMFFVGLLGYADYGVDSRAEFEALRASARQKQLIVFTVESGLFAVLYGIWRVVTGPPNRN